MEISLPVRPPFSLHSVMYSHGWIQLAPFRAGEQGFHYTTRLKTGRVAALDFQEAPGEVRVTVDTPPGAAELSAAERAEIDAQANWMLGLQDDFSTFYALAQSEPKLAQVVERAQGRILRSPGLFEDVIKTILTTNTLWAATKRMNQNLVDQFGEPLPGDPVQRAFPSLESLAAADEQNLREVTRLGYRAPYILSLARQVASGDLDLEALKESGLPTLELRRRLLAIKGVGPYAAANLLMLLGHYDFIPVDSWAAKMVSLEWYAGEPVTPTQIEAVFERWGKYKGLAYYCWNWSNPG